MLQEQAEALAQLEYLARGYPQKRRSNNWKPGQTGNPFGRRLSKERQAALDARTAELCQHVIDDLGGDLNPLQTALARQAAINLAYAEVATRKVELRSRLVNTASRLIEKLRSNIRQREADKPAPTLSELLGR